ncbi:MAG: hypothetical protein LC104_07300 [Bacteroidales bacterium]|nr:hypothetical protein [Bacteroidales bacterium]
MTAGLDLRPVEGLKVTAIYDTATGVKAGVDYSKDGVTLFTNFDEENKTWRVGGSYLFEKGYRNLPPLQGYLEILAEGNQSIGGRFSNYNIQARFGIFF